MLMTSHTTMRHTRSVGQYGKSMLYCTEMRFSAQMSTVPSLRSHMETSNRSSVGIRPRHPSISHSLRNGGGASLAMVSGVSVQRKKV